ncbi:DUF4190 domain-containing protein [Oceanobacillus jeddahense]|uniref:DUF4190 domain-containing protein n=1 Tax=Oceanobacillus jeddahense TaxID=1462527 RepID=A0ABY5JM30_9BACI|nr:DUF4190 domain-containing protein [Oceanobacillus jeddahense]UUI01350.1 DUF4190 domain-containing protein [Oceanobacillus jeddahense]
MSDHKTDKHIQDTPNHGQKPKYEHTGETLDSKRMEEFSAELTDADLPDFEEEKSFNPGTLYGWGSIILAIISFFTWPVMLGAASIVFGFVARSRGTNILGIIGIVAGILSLISAFFVIPFFS